MKRQMHLGLFILGTGSHVAGWRYPGAVDSFQDFAAIQEIGRTAERGKFDLIFMGDNLYADAAAHPSYTLRLEPLEADHLRAAATLMHRQSRRSLILWMTDFAETAMQPEVLDAAAQLVRRHLLLFVAVSQLDLQRQAGAMPETVDAMFETAAAQELLDRRERLLRRLEERGAMTLETQPELLAASVLNRYLEVKERGIL